MPTCIFQHWAVHVDSTSDLSRLYLLSISYLGVYALDSIRQQCWHLNNPSHCMYSRFHWEGYVWLLSLSMSVWELIVDSCSKFVVYSLHLDILTSLQQFGEHQLLLGLNNLPLSSIISSARNSELIRRRSCKKSTLPSQCNFFTENLLVVCQVNIAHIT